MMRVLLLNAALALSLATTALAETYADAEELFRSGKRAEAVDLLHVLADQGDTKAMISLGSFYRVGGELVERDDEQARELFTRALDAGDLHGAEMLSRSFFKFVELEDTDRAANVLAHDYAVIAAEGGNTQAMLRLGEMYDRGLGVDPDADAAIRWTQEAFDAGDPDATHRLGLVLAERGRSQEELARAVTLLEEVIENPDTRMTILDKAKTGLATAQSKLD